MATVYGNRRALEDSAPENNAIGVDKASGSAFIRNNGNWELLSHGPLALSSPKAFGALGDGSGALVDAAFLQAHPEFVGVYEEGYHTKDYAGLMEAYYDAFGAPGAEHGTDNAKLNKVLDIPPGEYVVGDETLEFEKINGGIIRGAGRFATRIVGRRPGMTTMRLLAVSFTRIESLAVHYTGPTMAHTEGVLLDYAYHGNALAGARQGITIERPATSGTQWTLTDSSKAWTVNQHAGRYVLVHAGPVRTRTRILSNSADTLVLEGNTTTAFDGTSGYLIIDTPIHVDTVLTYSSGTKRVGIAGTYLWNWFDRVATGQFMVMTGGAAAGENRSIATKDWESATISTAFTGSVVGGDAFLITASIADSGTATGGTVSRVVADISVAGDGSNPGTDYWKEMRLVVTSGTGKGQVRRILANDAGALILERGLRIGLDGTSRWKIYGRPGWSAACQSSTFRDLHISGEDRKVAYGITVALSNAYVPGDNAQGSELLFGDVFVQWTQVAGYTQRGLNALQNRFEGGNFANCQRYAIWNFRGAVNISTVSFQNIPPHVGIGVFGDIWDIRHDNAVNDVSVAFGCRTESYHFLSTVNDHRAVVIGLSMSVGLPPDWQPAEAKSASANQGLGDWVRASGSAGAKMDGRFWRCTTGGTTHSSNQPDWASVGGLGGGASTISDNTVVWTLAKYDVLSHVSSLIDSHVVGGGCSLGNTSHVMVLLNNTFTSITPLGNAEKRGQNTVMLGTASAPGFHGLNAREPIYGPQRDGRQVNQPAKVYGKVLCNLGKYGALAFHRDHLTSQLPGYDVGVSTGDYGDDLTAERAVLAIWGILGKPVAFDGSSIMADRRGLDQYVGGGQSVGNGATAHPLNRSPFGRSEDGRIVFVTSPPGASGATPNAFVDAAIFDKYGNFGTKKRTTRAIVTASDGDTTPDVSSCDILVLNNSAATTITDFDGGSQTLDDGQELTVEFTNGNSTLQNNAAIKLAGAADFVGTMNDTLTLIRRNGVWKEKARSIN